MNLLKGPIWKTLVLFSLPILISNIFQQLYNTVDMMIVGHYLGDQALASVGSSAAIYDLIVGFTLGVGNGMGVVIARYYGSGDVDRLKKGVVHTLGIGLGMSIIVMILGQYFLFSFLEMLNVPSHIIHESHEYIYFITMFASITFLYNMGAGLLRAIGNSLTALYILVFASIVNVVLDIVMITQWNMGIKGAAVATICSQIISVLLCYVYIYRRCDVLVPSRRHIQFDSGLFRDLLSQGFSMGLMGSIVSVGSVILQSAINGLGVVLITAQTAGRRLAVFFMMPMIAMASGLTTFISQNYGAKKYDRIVLAVRYANIYGILYGISCCVFLWLVGGALVVFISGSNDPVVLQNGSAYLQQSSTLYAVLAVLFNMRNALQGLGEKVIPLFSSIIELIGKILFVWLLIPKLHYAGVIWCEPTIWVFMVIQLLWAFYRHPVVREVRQQMNTSS